MATVADFDLLASGVDNLTVQDQGNPCHGTCAICLETISLQDTALIKGCDHSYCVTCILRWASYNEHPKCPQCKNPFESLFVHRTLDGSLHDYMIEESLCLLLRASWFKPLVVVHKDDLDDEFADVYQYMHEEEYREVVEEDLEDDDLEEVYFNNSTRLRIGNRRWGENGFVRSGRQEARPVHNTDGSEAASSSERISKKELGRRAKRALKRETADKAAAVKHEQHLARMGRK